MSRFEATIGTDIQVAADWLKQGEVIGMPTETVYGLAGNALDAEAVTRIFTAKNRPTFNPLIVHVHGVEQLAELVQELPNSVKSLAAACWPGPLTLLLPKTDRVPDLVTAGHPRVAVRIPNHPVALELLQALDFPLAAPSANPFGYISPTTAEHVRQQLHTRIPYVLDGGPTEIGIESTILGWEPDGTWKWYRIGGYPLEALETLVGPIEAAPHHAENPQSSGRLKSHYAPNVPLVLGDVDELLNTHGKDGVGVLAFDRSVGGVSAKHQRVLSESGDLGEAARNLFAYMRELDEMDVSIILAQRVPDRGLGRAINDRLGKAVAENKE
ncbi:L-threonylcarbamoyladenylate synthase [Pontibacter sp. G13]|uniref:L-threonylcarbamoyladenylate synthase n=1 Tax=Pontibacter sp. G13 TaxID=3074898 RepID=UPI00288A0AA6|nr:L-threonylcarbamoyladenylate synthase [Pontibacter sp. G13]WNJ17933.1 L-threonylcarbamoyladenylate synthase [Pontibacter sp. G13]